MLYSNHKGTVSTKSQSKLHWKSPSPVPVHQEPKKVAVVSPSTSPSIRPSTSLFDPFRLWSRRDELSFETIHGVLHRVASDGPCRSRSLHFPSASSLNQIALAIQAAQKSSKKKVVIAVLGDSVAADKEGFVAALQPYLSLSPLISFSVELRNLAKGATGPRFTYNCNDLTGDEDVVIYETVRPYEQDALIGLASTLKSTGFGVILVHWRGTQSWGMNKTRWGFFEAADSCNLPLINLNEDKDNIIECLPPDANMSIPAEKVIYRDETHPNRLGEIILAAMIGHTIEEALKQPVEHSLQSNSTSQNDVPLVKKFSADAPICFDRLNCTEGLSKNTGMHSCLYTNTSEGFMLKSLPSGNVWWEGTAPGHMLDIFIDRPCSEIFIFHNKRPSNGMVQILVDGKVLNSTFSPLAN